MRAPHHAGLAALPAAAAATLGCQQAALTEHNPASNAIWWVSGAIFLVLVVILAVELSDGLRTAWRRLRGRDEGRTEADPEAKR